MPNVSITIGGRTFEVACQPGEEHFLQSAAEMLDAEAKVLVEQIGRMPEGRMLLMSGLMLADKTAGLQDQLKKATAEMKRMQSQLDTLKAEREEVDVRALATLANRTEALATKLETGAP
jgi:cell division protein ZapA